jgi:hypothetical protein
MALSDNSIIRVAAKFLLANASEIVNVYHFVMDSVGDVDEADVLDDVLSLVEGLMANVTGQYSTTMSLDEVEVWVRNVAADRWDLVGAIDGTWAGSVATSEIMPAAVSPLVVADTVDAHSRGRKYLPPLNEAGVLSLLLTSAALTAFGNFLDDYGSTYVGTYAEWIPGVWQVVAKAFAAFTGSGKVTTQPAYQRRRKAGVGS